MFCLGGTSGGVNGMKNLPVVVEQKLHSFHIVDVVNPIETLGVQRPLNK